VLCVHGLARNARDFDFLAEALAADFRVIAVDMPGRGKSEWLKEAHEYDAVSYLANLRFLLEALRLDSVYWVGTSMGGLLGMMLAAAEPSRLRALVLNDVGAWVPAAALRRLGRYVGVATHFPCSAAAEQALREFYAPFGITDERHWRHLFAHSLEEAPGGGVRVAYDPAIGAPLRDPERIQDLDLWCLWEGIDSPTLLLRGELSDILPEETAQRMLGARAEITYHVFPGVGHAPALMDTAQIQLVHRWLDHLRRT
jgi:pimeloyl-ACP methyl ester carboxylesterase